MKLEKFANICENLGWCVSFDEDGTATIGQDTPAGEDFSFYVNKNRFLEDVKEYAANFDVDEHVQENFGVKGAPGARQLVEDAEYLDNELHELAIALSKADDDVAPEIGNYVVVEGYAQLSDEDRARLGDFDEWPVAYMCVQKDFFKEFVKQKLGMTMEEFWDTYTYDMLDGMTEVAANSHNLAFVYRPTLSPKFVFPAEKILPEHIKAYTGYLIRLLRDTEDSEILHKLIELADI